MTVPAAAHVTGGGGFVFVTDLHIENLTTRVVEADLLFFRAGVTEPYRARLILAPGETRSYFDVIGNRFGLTNAVGALRLNADSGLRMTSRTYTQVGGGTFGQAVSGVVDPEETTDSRHVTGLARTEQFRSNLGAVNPSGSPQQFRILLCRLRADLHGFDHHRRHRRPAGGPRLSRELHGPGLDPRPAA